MKLTRILTKKLTSFWLMSLAGVAFICFLTAMVSFIQLTYTFQQQKVTELENLIEQEYTPQASESLEAWLPPLLRAYRANSFTLSRNNQPIFEYLSSTPIEGGVHYQSSLGDGELMMKLTLPQPFSKDDVSWGELLIIIIGCAAVFTFVRFGFRWFSVQLTGIEDLALRSSLILSGKHDKALAEKGDGKPRLINRALTHLLLELDDAHKERARFDQFIRSNTFLDASTGIGNRLFLKNRLDALSNHSGMMTPGVLYLLEIEDLDLLSNELGEYEVDELLSQLIATINQILGDKANSIFSRRSYNQFAVVVPQISQNEADQLVAKLLRLVLNQMNALVQLPDDCFHIGGAYFKVGDDKDALVEEAELALRSAQFQGNSSWFMYDKGAVDGDLSKGSVRWRSFLENVLVSKRIFLFSQPVVDSDSHAHHQEVTCRLRDTQGNLVRATLFLPMATKCGLTPQIERQVIEMVLFDLLPKHKDNSLKFSINLSLDTLMSRAFVRWLKTTLLEYRHLAPRLIFEVNEDILVHHQEQLVDPLDMLNKMGASISVDRVGQQVVSTEYIHHYPISLIKLHRSIVNQIHLRAENQLFVRSLIGGLFRTGVQVCAEGVEVFEEWQTLQILGVSAGQGSFFSEPIEEV
ncbi:MULTISPECIES: RNase E specificity factor CsrD [unclassified Shewanella]|uniref:RNase E specificity factor CsrD n=1 Tax=unclassified Shewanella TaxID=196818 RepID=UPI001BC0D3FF|nr:MULTISPECIES: RNase E specificity factor CsrD [unclassified Shewanella]GIU13911.1 RNase E specificity factor CsrD [Shewanella sp. MBTL60-112-B1]GIU28437.1 RNase E specificity factor CsrD [Shewanella sp. MBTL60-112-B2]